LPSPQYPQQKSRTDPDRNWRRFIFFRVLFNSRFYYPVLAVLFLDLGLSVTQYTILNLAWALAIVFTDVPAGALADRVGRKPLVVAATLCMIGEMLLLLLAPQNGGLTLFLFCLANRVLSGIAEGMASGADEALVFDSLAEQNRSSDWPLVLDQVMRWQGVGMVIAMLVGGAVYDPVFMNRIVGIFGFSVNQSVTLRIPICLNLVSALIALWVVLGFREPLTRKTHVAPVADEKPETAAGALALVLSAGKWISRSPVALFVILGGLALDSIIRLFLTLSSSYFRLISLPEVTYGFFGATIGLLGLVVSPIARQMVNANSLAKNYIVLALVTIGALIGIAWRWQLWGVLFILPVSAVIIAVGFMASYYLNALADSGQRATVLSFKGLAFNLGYGFISLLFALLLQAFRDGAHPEQALAQGLCFLPPWLIFTLIVLGIAFWRRRAVLRKKY
jgi:MFS family permease